MIRTVPTDLLRAFITVLDLKGYTRAGELLGRSQPAISLQIKRLQDLLGVNLFAKDMGAGVLTEQGQVVANYARRILALNDEMVSRLSERATTRRLRLGIPGDYADLLLPEILGRRGSNEADAPVEIACDTSANVLAGLREHRFDVVVARTEDGPGEGAFLTWREPLVWVGHPEALAQSAGQLRIVACSEGDIYRRAMLSTLAQSGIPYEIVYSSPNFNGLVSAIQTCFGVSVVAERSRPLGLPILDSRHGLPSLPDLTVGVYVCDGHNRQEARAFASRLANSFREREVKVA